MDVIASFVKQRFELSKAIKDEELLDKVVMSDSTKAKVKEECGVSDAFFHVIMGKLRKNKIIVGDRINPKLIPKDLSDGDTSFQLLLHFDLDGNSNK
jgi:translation initiation factor IF-1